MGQTAELASGMSHAAGVWEVGLALMDAWQWEGRTDAVTVTVLSTSKLVVTLPDDGSIILRDVLTDRALAADCHVHGKEDDSDDHEEAH